ncbi:hypothetical protein HK100_004446 [Physocladia obscura]|uniref:SAC domain-containing protein n=1 Tax=Physocladia obscura TaxID=109957 RepID=A0AAD5SVD1_9FUNG|nr:hypothetical protein HK100_004446 [Physocladia obscura]
MGIEAFLTKHFGGIPRSLKDLEWIYRIRPTDPPIVPPASEYRTISPGSQIPFKRPNESAIYNNRYFARDTRRAYPATVVYTSDDIVKLTGATQQRISSSATTPSEESNITTFLPSRPPGLQYRWERSLPHLKPTDLNPDYYVRGFKRILFKLWINSRNHLMIKLLDCIVIEKPRQERMVSDKDEGSRQLLVSVGDTAITLFYGYVLDSNHAEIEQESQDARVVAIQVVRRWRADDKSHTSVHVSIPGGAISISQTTETQPQTLDAEGESVFAVPLLIGFVHLYLALNANPHDENATPAPVLHLILATRANPIGALRTASVYSIDQACVVPTNDAFAARAALFEALDRRKNVSLANLSPIDYTRAKSAETVKASVGLGVDTMKAGVGLGVGTVKAGVDLGVGLVSNTTQLVASIGSNTLSAIGLKGKEKKVIATPNIVANATEDLNNSSDTSHEAVSLNPPKRSTVGTVSKMFSSLNPFRPNPLAIRNANTEDEEESSDETSDHGDTSDQTSERGSIETTASANSVKTDSARLLSGNQNAKTLIGSLGSLAHSGYTVTKHIAGIQPPPVTPESIQSNDIKTLFELQTFFYSTEGYDLTRRCEDQDYTSNNDSFDDRFFWNKFALKPLFEVGLGRNFITPLIQGFVEVRSNISLKYGSNSETEPKEGQSFDFAVISRRSKYRAGFRYERRGIDDEGQVANFVETEMIVFSKVGNQNHTGSFLQIRGSIPLFWSQTASTKTLNPTPILEKSDAENTAAMALHLNDLESQYKNIITIVDLVGQKGRESILGTRFKTTIETLKSNTTDNNKERYTGVAYRAYDFHAETKGLHYEKLEKLVDMVDSDFERMQYYWGIEGSEEACLLQKGVVRTNCMDCLDRTNVVQSIFARHMLDKILLRMGISDAAATNDNEGNGDSRKPGKQTREDGGNSGSNDDFEAAFKNIWANNGDRLSTAYTGTGALKGDFTRTGVRNVKGMLNDAANSVSRLYADNFQNKVRQQAVDVFLGQ